MIPKGQSFREKQQSLNNPEQALADILGSLRKRQETVENSSNNFNETCIVTASPVISPNELSFMSPTEGEGFKGFSFMSPNIIESDSIITQKQVSIEKSSNLKGFLFSNNVNNKDEKSTALATNKSTNLKALLNINNVNPASVERSGNCYDAASNIPSKSNKQPSSSNKKIDNNTKAAVISSKFASSKLVQSPDPLTMPLPDFDESIFG